MDNRLVVGVSGRPAARAALQWAFNYARPRRLEIELVHVVDATFGTTPAGFLHAAREQAELLLAREAEEARSVAPDLTFRTTVLEGSPTGALTDWAVGAQLLVVGSHALGRFRDYVFSTQAAQIAAYAGGSVVVVPEREEQRGTGVVVGVDGSEASLAAVTFAADQADRLGERLTALYCWSAPVPWTEDRAMIDWPMVPDEADRLVLAEAVAGLAERYPDLKLDLRLDLGLPVDALVSAATGARLLVVGSHGRHGFARFWLGSVSHVLVLTMPCPVAVIRVAVTETGPVSEPV
ncbi:universal stress protein [Cryobacterium sp. TMT2-15-1]|uniref:universal stress protein n=1 Tax=Cryobacterium sp. TMT2-15-1 TaxID=1259246 RepID=UPI00106AF738|nr:universal stress protein [Cryobacterium sp. TMT2-15-1]TFC61094.1 universal stress protein [Cryobacterium sp. TMT2-15-1]